MFRKILKNCFCYLFIILSSCSTQKQSFQKVSISNLSHQNYKIIENGLLSGTNQYIDRKIKFMKIPSFVKGATFIQTANDDKNSKGEDYLTFDVDQDVSVYIAHSNEVNTKPLWLKNNYKDLGKDIITTDGNYRLFKKEFSKGQISIGGNIEKEDDRGKSMYTIIVVSKSNSLTNSKMSDVDEKLSDLGISEFPNKKELENITVPEKLLNVKGVLSEEDINKSFSNIDDLKWLEPIAINSKVFLFGEEHMSQVINHLRNRILFALNTYDRYPLLLLEKQFSYSGYYDYYVGLIDDDEAERFYRNIIHDMINTQEGYELLEHIRRWNKHYPEKRIHIGTYDVEWDYKTTLNSILVPYFQKVDSSYELKIQNIKKISEVNELLGDFEKLIETAKLKKIVGEFEFLTPGYIERILKNLKSRIDVNNNWNNSNRPYYRQTAMIRNLTDYENHAKFFKESKVLLHAGMGHTRKRRDTQKQKYYYEGEYFEKIYGPTKGKTFSLSLKVLSFSLGAMENVNIDNALYQSTDYKRIVKQFQTICKQGLVSADKYYIRQTFLMGLDIMFFKLAYENNIHPMLLKNIQWKKLKSAGIEFDEESDYIKHDAQIIIPQTPLIVAIEKQ